MYVWQVIELMEGVAPEYKINESQTAATCGNVNTKGRLFPLDVSIEPTPDSLLETPYNIEEYPQPLSGYLHIVNEMRLAPGYMNEASQPMSIFISKANILTGNGEPDDSLYYISAIVPICHRDCMLCLDNILHTTRLTDQEFLRSVRYGYTARSASGNVENEERWQSLIRDYENGELIQPFSNTNSRLHVVDKKGMVDILEAVARSGDRLSLFTGARRVKLYPCSKAKSARK